MSLLLGLYSFDNHADSIHIAEAVRIFGHNNKRNIHKIVKGKLTLWLAGAQVVNNETLSNAPLFVSTGRLYNKKEVYAAFINKQVETVEADGEFTLVTVSSDGTDVFIRNDYMGIYPLYYTETANGFWFCNEYEPLSQSLKSEPDTEAIREYYTWGAVTGDKTFFKNITNLHPFSTIHLSGNSINVIKNPRKAIPLNTGITIPEAAAHTAMLLKNAIQKRVALADSNWRVMLTGGADTRLILSCLDDNQRQKLLFTTYLTPPLSTETDADVRIASQLATELNLKHEVHKYELWNKPFGTHYFDFKREIVQQKYISGHFGSEILKAEIFKATDKRLILAVMQHDKQNESPNISFTSRLKKRLIKDKFFWNDAAPSQNITNTLNTLAFCENKQFLFLLQTAWRSFFTRTWGGTRSIYFDQPAYMPFVFINPFQGRYLLEFLLSLPPHFFGISAGQLYSTMFRNHFPEFMHIPTNSPLANDNLSGFTPANNLNNGYDNRLYNYDDAFGKHMAHPKIDTYYSAKFLKNLMHPAHEIAKQSFTDFETWADYAGLKTGKPKVTV